MWFSVSLPSKKKTGKENCLSCKAALVGRRKDKCFVEGVLATLGCMCHHHMSNVDEAHS
jgi:hypothetical protein